MAIVQEVISETALVLKDGWTVAVKVDREKRLNLLIFQTDRSDIVAIDSGKSDGVDGEPLDLCFTSSQIEEDRAAVFNKVYKNTDAPVRV